MSLRNVITAHGLDSAVTATVSKYETSLLTLSERVVKEFSYGPIVDQYVHQGVGYYMLL